MHYLDIVGYSRGAAISCMFADKISRDYKKISTLTQPPEIRFVGLFDTVASFGNPLDENEVYFRSNLSNNVQNAFHAMSLDLHSPGFGLDRVYGANVLEVWFRGGHGDIGGNSSLGDQPNRSRTNITLNFMLKKAIAVNIELKDLKLSNDLVSNQDLSYPFDLKAPISVIGTPRSDVSRQPRKYDIFHYSFFDENNVEIKPAIIGNSRHIDIDLEDRDKLVIEELANESELSRQQLLQLTPVLIEKFPNTQSLYDYLYGCESIEQSCCSGS